MSTNTCGPGIGCTAYPVYPVHMCERMEEEGEIPAFCRQKEGRQKIALLGDVCEYVYVHLVHVYGAIHFWNWFLSDKKQQHYVLQSSPHT